MTERAWKRTEREIARRIGGRRVPITGRARGDRPDIEQPWLSVEVKHRRRLPAWLAEALDQAKASASDDQLPIAVLHQANRPYGASVVLIMLEDFEEWFL